MLPFLKAISRASSDGSANTIKDLRSVKGRMTPPRTPSPVELNIDKINPTWE